MEGRRRRQVPPMEEYRAIAQPPEVRNRRSSEHWLGDLYQRDISPYLSRPLVRLGFSANAVTAMMIIAGACAGLALLIPGLPGVVLAAVLTQVQMLIDAADGEVARWRQTFSPAGLFLDKVGHYTAESMIPLCLGVRAAGGFGDLSAGYGWTTLGALLALLIVLNKALNDMVHVSRAFSGMPRIDEASRVGAPRGGLVASLRKVARWVPLHRLYHSVELSLLALAATLVAMIAGPVDPSTSAAQWLLRVLVPLAAVTVLGHFATIMASTKLKAPTP